MRHVDSEGKSRLQLFSEKYSKLGPLPTFQGRVAAASLHVFGQHYPVVSVNRQQIKTTKTQHIKSTLSHFLSFVPCIAMKLWNVNQHIVPAALYGVFPMSVCIDAWKIYHKRLHVQYSVLMMNIRCSKHVEDKKN